MLWVGCVACCVEKSGQETESFWWLSTAVKKMLQLLLSFFSRWNLSQNFFHKFGKEYVEIKPRHAPTLTFSEDRLIALSSREWSVRNDVQLYAQIQQKRFKKEFNL